MNATAEMFSIYREINKLGINTREVVNNIYADVNDFEVDGYRFISKDQIDDIQCDELSSDLYVLGCFNASFLSGILGAPEMAIKKMQEAEAFEAIGTWIQNSGCLHELQEKYVRLDGYGHHFAHYDGEENELDSANYYYFRVN